MNSVEGPRLLEVTPVIRQPPGVVSLDDLASHAAEAFRAVHERVFAGDPAVNANLRVETVQPAVVEGVPTLVLITPWTLNGLLFPPSDRGPAELVVAGTRRRAVRGDVPPLGAYWTVNLVPDVSGLAGQRQARTLANTFAAPFREGVRDWLAAQGRQQGRGEGR